MLSQLEQIEKNGVADLKAVKDETGLGEWHVAHLGRSAPIMQVFDKLGQLAKEERPIIGKRANEVKRTLEAAEAERNGILRQAAITQALQSEKLDVTLPGRPVQHGRLHPSTQTLRKVYRIFAEMGFQVYRSRDVETDEYNFQLLNFPPHHPAREMQDSFYLAGDYPQNNALLLRTHTSPGQVRSMREFAAANPQNPPPVRIILPGMCYRYEQITARSEIHFGAGFGEREMTGAEAGAHVSAIHPTGEIAQCTFQVAKGDPLANCQPLHLIELDLMRCIHLFITIYHARQEHTDWFGCKFAHGTYLAWRGMRAQDYTRNGSVKGVPHIARRVVGWDIEQFKIKFFTLNIW